MYMKMLQRKGGKVVDRTLRKCYIAVLAQEQKFNKALGYEICATDGDNVLDELLELWEFVQEKRQWFIREHEQLAGKLIKTQDKVRSTFRHFDAIRTLRSK